MRNHDSIDNDSSNKRRKRAIALLAATATGLGALTLSTSSDSEPLEANRYPAPPAADTLRLQHIAESGDKPTVIAEEIADEYNDNPTSAGHLTAQEVKDHMYSVGGNTPEGHPIPTNDEIININEHMVADIPVEKVFDNQ